jgi:uncharacterized membrane protein
MLGLPLLPGWSGIHPLVVHFPVALLMVAPLFVLIGVTAVKTMKNFSIAALVLMALGTLATFIAVPTGEAAARLADRTPEVNIALERHENLAERTRIIFTFLTLLYALVLFGPRLMKRELRRGAVVALQATFLFLYAGGALVLINTAHNGGRLVHELGVHALLPSAESLGAAPAECTPIR